MKFSRIIVWAGLGSMLATVLSWGGLYLFGVLILHGEGSLFDTNPDAAKAFFTGWLIFVVIASLASGYAAFRHSQKSSPLVPTLLGFKKFQDHLVFRDQIMRRSFTFIFGFLIGFGLALVPDLIEHALAIDLCRESCPSWFKGISLFIYVTMPFFWGVFFALTLGKPNGHISAKKVTIAASVSIMVMLAITFYSYAHQARLL